MHSLRSKRTNLAAAKFRTKLGGKSEGGEADTIYLLARVTLRGMVESQSGMAEPHLRGKYSVLHSMPKTLSVSENIGNIVPSPPFTLHAYRGKELLVQIIAWQTSCCDQLRAELPPGDLRAGFKEFKHWFPDLKSAYNGSACLRRSPYRTASKHLHVCLHALLSSPSSSLDPKDHESSELQPHMPPQERAPELYKEISGWKAAHILFSLHA